MQVQIQGHSTTIAYQARAHDSCCQGAKDCQRCNSNNDGRDAGRAPEGSADTVLAHRVASVTEAAVLQHRELSLCFVATILCSVSILEIAVRRRV